MEKPIRVSVMGREYALRVQEENEALMREVASYVDGRMQAFREAHPDQAKLTTAVITALALAEELHLLRREHDREKEKTTDALAALADELADALPAGSNGEEKK